MMLRSSRLLASSVPRLRRFQSSSTKLSGVWEHDTDPINAAKSLSTDMTSLPFAYRKESEAFGQLVRDHHHDLNDKNDSKIKVISREEILRMANGEIDQDHYEQIAGQESRLHPKTVEARTNRNQIKIPERITKSIYNHMLALRLPKILRYQVAQTYIKLQDSQVYEPTRKPHENDVHIAAFFTQDYASTYQVLKELFQRKPDFNPKKVLDIGYGPATGMIALNEIMGAEFEPQVKDSLIIGHHGMQDRAKILLSRQLNEYPGALEDLFTEEEMAEGLRQDEDILFDDFIGEVKTNKIKVKTKLLDHMSPTKKYDLIIAQHQLLQDPNRFPYEVDENVDLLLKSLEPNGYLVLVERGTPLGFEAIARARQVMIRPERYENESGKIPRPYLKGSTSKPNSNIFKEFEELQYDESLDDSELAKELNAKFGEVSEDDLKFEDDILEGAEVLDELPEAPKIDYHISIVAPCSHHKKCPLQTLKPQYYTYPSGKKLQWCHFDKSVERPRFLLELKRGQVLSSRWERNGEISPGRGSGGSGRPDANNFELATYSYLIAERSGNDPVTIDEIEVERENNTHDYKVGSVTEEINLWPRIMQNPLKRKGHVTMSLCGTSGEIEKWTVTKSFDRIAYHDARKAHAGDLWPLNAKTKLQGRSNQDEALQVKLENYEKELMLKEKKEKRLTSKKSRKEFQLKAAEFTQRDNESPEEMVHVYTTKFNMSKRQRQKDSRGGLDQFYN